MDGSLGGLGPHFVALVIGGLLGSLGLTFAARGRRMQPWLAARTAPHIAAGSLALVALSVAAAWWIGRGVVDTAPSDFAALPLPLAFAFGLAVGLPISVPGLVAAWSESRRKDREAKRKCDFVPTKDDRREYAVRIVKQIQDVSPRPRELSASISGDGGTVLLFEGEIDAQEGERLTAALRADLAEVGFKRVEGRHGSNEWWSRV
ncbi:MAG: hypothetical protein AAF389_19080 [Gemmatimonadota bacterium]